MNLRFETISALCGLLAPLTGLVFIVSAVLISPWFSWTGNWLSDLGRTGTAAVLFNTGIILAGFLGVVFAFGMRKRFDTFLGTVLFFLGMVAFTGIGLFPETTGNLHLGAALAAFFMLSCSLIPIGLSLKKTERLMGLFIIAAGFASLISATLFILLQNAVAEMFPVVLISAFLMSFSFRILKGPVLDQTSYNRRHKSV